MVDARAVAPTAARSGWPRCGRGSRWARSPATTPRVARYRELLARGEASFEAKLWTGRHYRFDTSDGPSGESIMAGQLAGQWYADATGLGDLVRPERILATLRTIFAANVIGFEDGEMGAVNGIRTDGSVDESALQSAEVWVGVTYALAASMLGRGLDDEAWRTAWGAHNVTYNRGPLVPDPRGVRRVGRLPRQPVPPAALDLGDRARAPPARGAASDATGTPMTTHAEPTPSTSDRAGPSGLLLRLGLALVLAACSTTRSHGDPDARSPRPPSPTAAPSPSAPRPAPPIRRPTVPGRGGSSGATSSTSRPARRPTRRTGATRWATGPPRASRAGATASWSGTPTTRRTPRPTARATS